jgi:hypothetical protein
MSANYKLPNYTIYFDANIAYSKKPAEPISAKLLKAIKKASTLTRIDVRVPEVVVEELAYQQFVIAQAATENLKKNAKTLVEVSGLTVADPPDEEAMKAGVKALLATSLAQASFSQIPTPIESIDWSGLIQDSCWRCSPFEKPSSEDDLAEKGFRDKIILETAKNDASKIKDGVVAFVSGDNRLRAAFKDQATAKCSIEVYSNLRELIGNLELLSKTQSEGFTRDVLEKVGPFFDTISQGVIDKLIEEHSDEMSRPSFLSIIPPKQFQTTTLFPAPATTFSGNWFEEYQRWTPVTPVKARVSPPVFQPDEKKGDGRYHWLSTITLARILRRTETRFTGLVPEERIRTKEFDVKWSCKIDSHTATFSDPSVDSCTDKFRDAFLDANFQSRMTYGLPLYVGFNVQDV